MFTKTATSFFVIAAMAMGSACILDISPSRSAEPMVPFESDSEFERYMDQLAKQSFSWGGWWDYDMVASDGMGDTPESGATNEEITNNQEEGVDEGGIVKNIGSHLIILRQGRLYAVSVEQEGNPVQTGTIRVALDDALNSGVWYDEMLVRGRDIYVVGYRYLTSVRDEENPDEYLWWIHGATEVAHFVFTDSGEFERQDVLFFESADYYSGSNYASRMIDGRLLFYMPYYAFIYDRDNQGRRTRVPRFLEYEGDGQFAGGPPMFRGIDVFKPHRDPEFATFHTIVACDLDRGLQCRARSLIGDWSRQFYVTRERVYLWTSPWVVAFSLQTLTPTSHAVVGHPHDQFSFSERDGSLHVGITIQSSAWPLDDEETQESHGSRQALLSLPLDEFTAQGRQEIEARHLTELIMNSGYSRVSRNRHTEGWYIVALERNDEALPSVVAAHHLDSSSTIMVDLEGLYVSRIEAMRGFGALVAASNDRWGGVLELIPFRLGDVSEMSVEPSIVLEDIREGESRSHGFFFKPSETGGTFGLPILGSGDGWHWWGQGISNIAFFDLDSGVCESEPTDCEESPISLLGAISSSDESGGSCETSCVDWYGNTRPIFLGDRVFALMGSEIVEADISGGTAVPLGESLIMTRD